MARRIEIELTSKLQDGGYTWRAAGARQPKGVVDAGLVPDGAAVGEVYRAEVESGIDGVEVQSILPRKQATPLDPRGERIQVIGTPKSEPDIQVTLASKKGRRSDGPRERGRGDERGPRPPRGPREGARGAAAGADRGRPEGRSDRARPDRPAGAERAARAGAPSSSGGVGRSDRPDRAASGRTSTGRPGSERGGADRGRSDRRDTRRPPEMPTSTVYRNAMLATLRPEQLPIAEQLLRGGLPAVRQAIDEQNRASAAQGRPIVAPETILTIAEDLLPLTSLAAWKDRAAAAQQMGATIRVRDLRAVVTSARTVTLDEEGRATLKDLQGKLHVKTEELRVLWVKRIESALDDNRVADALETVSRAPDPGTRCPAELATRLAEAASAALTADLPPQAWNSLLEAVVASPVRRSVKPVGIPAHEECQAAAVRAAGHVPALAKLLGMRIPPPPPPSAAKRPALSGRRSS